MFNVYHNSLDQGHSFHDFQANFIEICKQHHAQRRALAFGFILFDFENPQIWKILNDREYWLALNQISGKYLTIFSINYKEKRKVRARSQGSGYISFLTSISDYRDPKESTNDILKKYFGDNLMVKYPAVMFFQVEKNQVIDALVIELDEQQIELAFLELKEYINSAVTALKEINNENETNYKEVFACLDRKVNSTKTIRKIKKYSRIGKSIIELGSAVAGLATQSNPI